MAGSIVKKLSADVVAGQNQVLVNDLNGLVPGNYFIKVLDVNTNKSFVKKITRK